MARVKNPHPITHINRWLDDLEAAFARKNGGDHLELVEEEPVGRSLMNDTRLHLVRVSGSGGKRRYTHTMTARDMYLYLEGLNQGLLSR